MTRNESELLVEALRWKVRYDDSNPDVGMGPFIESQLQDICIQCNMNLNVRELTHVIELYRLRYER